MGFLHGTFAGTVTSATPMVHFMLTNGVAVLLLAGTSVEPAADILVFHVFPGNTLDVALKLVWRFAAGILTRSSESSGNVVPGEVRQPSLLTSFVEELLDVVPTIPLHYFKFIRLEELLDDREEVVPRQDIGLTGDVRLES